MLGACFNASESPILSSPPTGLSVVSVETQTVQVAPEGTVDLKVESTEIAIRSLSIATFGTSGEVKIEVVSLSGAPDQDIAAPALDVYQFIQIGHDNVDDSNIEAVGIVFTVEQSWIESNGHAEHDIALGRYSDGWTILPTTIVGRDAGVITYGAVSPGLSLFAITAAKPDAFAATLTTPTPDDPASVPPALPTPAPAPADTPDFTSPLASEPTVAPPTATPPKPQQPRTPVPAEAPTREATARPTSTSAPAATATSAPSPPVTATPRPTPTASPIPAPTATQVPTSSPTAAPTITPVATPTPVPTV